MKRLIAAAGAVALSLGLVACGGSGATSTPESVSVALYKALGAGSLEEACPLTTDPDSLPDNPAPATVETCSYNIKQAIPMYSGEVPEDAEFTFTEPFKDVSGTDNRKEISDSKILMNGENMGRGTTTVINTDSGWLIYVRN